MDVEPIGDFTGFDGCDDYNTCDWFQQSVDDSRQQDAAMDGQILDFETDDPVPEAHWKFGLQM